MDVKKLIEMPFDEFLKFVEKEVVIPNQYNRKGISLNFPYDLRESLDMKSKNCSMWHKWTAFLNNSGTLCHVIAPESDIVIRVKFSYSIKHLSPKKQLEMIIGRIKNWIMI